MTAPYGPSVEAAPALSDLPERADPTAISLRDFIAFVAAQDLRLNTEVAALEQDSPNLTTPAAEITEHAGRVGDLAGQRHMLTLLVATFIKADAAEAKVPEQREPTER